jgi:1,4-alpha-glucan branching enzyme
MVVCMGMICVPSKLLPSLHTQFKYVVDDVWSTAPFEPIVTNAQDTVNNQRVVAPSIQFSVKAPGASQCLVVGDWDDWQYSLLMKKDQATGVFTCQANLKV